MIALVAGDPADPAVVLLHAGTHARPFWEASAHSLVSAGHHVVSLHLRSSADSNWAPGSDCGLNAMTDKLLAVLRQLRSKPALIGASLGGLVALQAVGESGTRIASSLVLVDLPPGLVPEELAGLRGNMRGYGGEFASRAEAAARRVNLPTFLVEGALGDPADDEGARQLQTLIPNAAYVNLASMHRGATGDRNGVFNAALMDFLNQCIALGQPT